MFFCDDMNASMREVEAFIVVKNTRNKNVIERCEEKETE